MNNKVVNIVKEKRVYLYTCLTVLTAVLVIFGLLRISPFGDKSLLIWDLNIQYVEFFSYLRNVLLGNANIAYSFSKSLGGSLVALFGYYLSSPINLLVVFFKQENMQTFVIVSTIIKIVLCGLTSAIFLRIRFEKKLSNNWVVLFSCGYALSQYTLSQMSNIMWLDGCYLLPLMLIGVWKFVKEKKITPLVISIACSIIFNWYTGYMNCFFIPFYYLYEKGKHVKYENVIKYIKEFFGFCFWEIVGVGISSFLFVPVVYGLKNGKGSFSFDIFRFQTNGSLLDIIRGFVIGSEANNTNISLFCGTFFLVGVIAYFINNNFSIYEKIISGCMLLFLGGSCFFKPLENVWNGFRYVYSYFYRFSYIVIFFLLYLVAVNQINESGLTKKDYRKIIFGCISVLLILDEIKSFNVKKLWLEIIILFVVLIIHSMRETKIMNIFVSAIIIGELIINGVLICKPLYTRNQDAYVAYINEQKKILSEIEKVEGSDSQEFYRIEQTKNRGNSLNKLNAYYDEALSYGYRGISQYSSAFDACTVDFIANLGYSDVRDITLYDEPILSSDSLLGVKYLMADIEYPGWSDVGIEAMYNDKKIYLNSYAFPLAMQIQELKEKLEENSNPFLYQNELFSELTGRDVEVFKKLDKYCNSVDGNLEVSIDKVNTDGIVYGYGRFSKNRLKVFIDGEYRCDYQDWLSYLVFNVGTTNNNHIVNFENAGDCIDDEIEFYYLDMKLFKQIQEDMKSVEAELICWDDGYVEISCQNKGDNNLFLTIPYDKGWKAYCGNEELEVKKAVDGLIQISTEGSQGKIVLEYGVPGKNVGIIVSVLSLFILILGNIKRCRTNEKTNIHSSPML